MQSTRAIFNYLRGKIADLATANYRQRFCRSINKFPRLASLMRRVSSFFIDRTRVSLDRLEILDKRLSARRRINFESIDDLRSASCNNVVLYIGRHQQRNDVDAIDRSLSTKDEI